ncbi:response regulator [Tropicimonas sp. IMCC34043]|uniref:response regulator n=1 Tax=Tropicimonas sp. IMCC34043 TaxID=2248760 RepID=UPI000E27A78A|nr:response regulator [Tropicimonas sp. IMCC34043]
MNEEFASLPPQHRPTRERPLQGLTILLVEDSRYACEAFRLLCLRSGARLRRADCLASARRHLATYRPSVAIVDLGLPDGSGTDLIAELARADAAVPVILATSGSPEAEAQAIAAGAHGFIGKPVPTLAGFQHAILEHLPVEVRPAGPRAVTSDQITPDLLALRDDLSQVASILAGPVDRTRLGYAAQFLSSVAHAARDERLAEAATALRGIGGGPDFDHALGHVASLVETRLTGTGPF